MARDAAATRGRILDAAVDEFAAHGLAGARVDRIAVAAAANKRSIYVYFHDKERLFAAALHHVISAVVEAVPLTEDDLPGYAGRLFDHLLAHPEAMRLSLWRKLERPTAGPDVGDVYREKVTAMRHAPTTDGIGPADLIILISGLASGWLISPDDLLAADGSDPTSPERLALHRAALLEAARRVCTTSPPRTEAP